MRLHTSFMHMYGATHKLPWRTTHSVHVSDKGNLGTRIFRFAQAFPYSQPSRDGPFEPHHPHPPKRTPSSMARLPSPRTSATRSSTQYTNPRAFHAIGRTSETDNEWVERMIRTPWKHDDSAARTSQSSRVDKHLPDYQTEILSLYSRAMRESLGPFERGPC
jgi:hypothetical protein